MCLFVVVGVVAFSDVQIVGVASCSDGYLVIIVGVASCNSGCG